MIDFMALYRELGISPDCTPEELKLAYRKRVFELHPDRTDGREEAMKTLNAGYAAVLDFRRAHGRFPGAPLVDMQGSVLPPSGRASDVGPPLPADGAPDEAARQPRWLVPSLLGVLALFGITQLNSQSSGAPAALATQEPRANTAWTTGASGPLQLGMSGPEVLSALGEPNGLSDGGTHWQYGPSWVRVACNQLIDWYSSPLEPLGTQSARPRLQDRREGFDDQEHCAQSP